MNGNFRVGSLFGIPFFINISWFFVLALTTLSFGRGLAAQFPWLGDRALVLGFVSGLLLFASVLLHELGHSFAARQQGIRVNSIMLFLFGGVASLEDEAKTPAGAFWIAVAGPLVSLALFALLGIVGSSPILNGPIAAMVRLLANINLMLTTFNMIPGLPLDGGNVLKAVVWGITGNRYRGIRWASRAGQLIGWSAILLGLLSILGVSNSGSFWTLIIGWFMLQNAGQAAQSANLQESLSGLTVADAVIEKSPVIGADCTLRELADEAVIAGSGNAWRRFLVKDDSDRLIGTISVDSLKRVPSEQWSAHQIRDFLQPIASELKIHSDKSLLEAIGQLEKQGTQSLAVTRNNGLLVGLLEKAEIINLLQKKAPPQQA